MSDFPRVISRIIEMIISAAMMAHKNDTKTKGIQNKGMRGGEDRKKFGYFIKILAIH